MKHALLASLLSSCLVACGSPPPRAPAVSVGESPSEVAPVDTSPSAADVAPPAGAPFAQPEAQVVVQGDRMAVSMEHDGTVRITGEDLAVTNDGAALRGEDRGLFLTDGEGHRFSVETIRTNDAPPTSTPR